MTSFDLGRVYEHGIAWIELNGPRILIAAVVFSIGQVIIKFGKKWLNRSLGKKDLHASVVPFLQSLIVVICQLLLFVVVLQILGIQLTIFAAGVASLGVTIGLALSGTLQNFASGLLILLLKPFKVGDTIQAQSQEGTVMSIQIFYTVVQSKDNKTIIIPNSKLSNEVIVNLPKEGDKPVEIKMNFAYSEDIGTIEDVIRSTVKNSTKVEGRAEPEITVKQDTADRFTISVKFWTDLDSAGRTESEVHKELISKLKSAGVKLPSDNSVPIK